METETGNLPNAYTGRFWDPDACLYHYRARVYDPRPRRLPRRARSALMLATDRVRYVSDRTWSGQRYIDVSILIASEIPAVEGTPAA